jgi:hypothetical protein
MFRAIFATCLIVGLMTPVDVLGQTEVKSRRYERVQRLTFEDDEVTARRQGPQTDIVDGSRFPTHSLLIDIREDFVVELIQSAEWL